MKKQTCKMKEISLVFALILMFSCNEKNQSPIKTGKYYAAHGFQNEHIVVTNDSTYGIYLNGKLIKSARWTFLPDKSQLAFSDFTELVDWKTGLIIDNPRSSVKLFKYRTKGILDTGFERFNFIHESLWDTAYHRKK